MDLRLDGKTVLVTGGSKGIGAACARSFAGEGCNLVLIARDRGALESTANEIRARYPIKVKTSALDLRKASDVDHAIELVESVDILVNNAGDIPAGSIEKVDDATWRHAWDLKMFSYLSLTRAAFSAMKRKGAGVIVNVIGMAGERPNFDYVCGSTANAGLAAFTKAMGQGSIEHGVRVLGVHPPATRTERIEAVHRALAKTRYGDETRVADLYRDKVSTPAIEPEQVADTVTYLASPRASQISGIVLNLGPTH
jgi:3-oxoacyl-[acyl-carrier protein] reductase